MIVLRHMLAELELRSIDDQWAVFEAMNRTGRATTRTPEMASNWGSAVYVISAHGIDAVGDSKREALNIWTACATRMIEEEMDESDILARAIATLESTRPMAMAEAVEACQIILNHEGDLEAGTITRARAVLNTIAKAQGTTFHALRTGQEVAA